MVVRRATGSIAVALLILSVLAASCGGGDSTPTPAPTESPAPTASPSPLPTQTPAATPDPSSIAPPDRDLVDLAKRFRGLEDDPPAVLRSGPFDYGIGAEEQFFVLELAGEPRIRTATATLRHVTEHAYFFVEDGFQVPASALERVGSDFETAVYPQVRAAFGPEPSPGVDADPRITLLHANLSGASGYFSGGDLYPAEIVPHSNEREMLYLDADFLSSPGVAYNSLVAHEFQHLIHEHADSGEESWVNEGLSQVAGQLVTGSSPGAGVFLDSPDTSLVDWPELGSSAVHYAASELFFTYLFDHYGGREQAKAVLDERRDGADGVQDYLRAFGTDFEAVFGDWVVANYLDDESGDYAHLTATTSVSRVTNATIGEEGEGTVGQFAADYFEVDAPAGARFSFDGADEVSVGGPEAGGSFYWSNRGDSIDSRMTRELDLTNVDSATLRFEVWHSIEEGWDYGYAAASTDGGRTWQALAGRQTTDYDPVGQSYGPGYTGESQGWLAEEIDLSPYAGSEVLIRFEYVTDGSTHGAGLAVDNISVPEIGLADDGSGDGWEFEGFVRIAGPLAQEWIVQVIDLESHEVSRLDLDGDNAGTTLLTGRSVIVVSAVTQGTFEEAAYSWAMGG